MLRRRDGKYYLDREWLKWRIRAEVHGIPHSKVANWDRDLERQNEISIQGGGLLVFSSYAIRHLAGTVGDQLERMFRSKGLARLKDPSWAQSGRRPARILGSEHRVDRY